MSRGRTGAGVSIVIGICGIALWLVLTRTQLAAQLRIPDWFLFTMYIGGGLVGAVAAVVSVFRGRGWTRFAAIAGLLIDLVLILFGLAILIFSLNPINPLPPGPFA
jgi:hypothetical protein